MTKRVQRQGLATAQSGASLPPGSLVQSPPPQLRTVRVQTQTLAQLPPQKTQSAADPPAEVQQARQTPQTLQQQHRQVCQSQAVCAAVPTATVLIASCGDGQVPPGAATFALQVPAGTGVGPSPLFTSGGAYTSRAANPLPVPAAAEANTSRVTNPLPMPVSAAADANTIWRALEAKCQELVERRVQQLAATWEEVFKQRLAELDRRLEEVGEWQGGGASLLLSTHRSVADDGPFMPSAIFTDLNASTDTMFDLDSSLKGPAGAEINAKILAGLAHSGLAAASDIAAAEKSVMRDPFCGTTPASERQRQQREQDDELTRWRNLCTQREPEGSATATQKPKRTSKSTDAGGERLERKRRALKDALLTLQSLSVRPMWSARDVARLKAEFRKGTGGTTPAAGGADEEASAPARAEDSGAHCSQSVGLA